MTECIVSEEGRRTVTALHLGQAEGGRMTKDYPTPGCSCEGYQRAVGDAARYRNIALGLSCMAKTTRGRCPDGVNWGVRSLCRSRMAGTFCDAVVREVDGE